MDVFMIGNGLDLHYCLPTTYDNLFAHQSFLRSPSWIADAFVGAGCLKQPLCEGDLRFESSVIQDGSKTAQIGHFAIAAFESSVIQDGSKNTLPGN